MHVLLMSIENTKKYHSLHLLLNDLSALPYYVCSLSYAQSYLMNLISLLSFVQEIKNEKIMRIFCCQFSPLCLKNPKVPPFQMSKGSFLFLCSQILDQYSYTIVAQKIHCLYSLIYLKCYVALCNPFQSLYFSNVIIRRECAGLDLLVYSIQNTLCLCKIQHS